jgi:hypothetical protein
VSSQLWHEAWLATRFGDQSRIDALLGGIMSYEDFYGDQPGPRPAVRPEPYRKNVVKSWQDRPPSPAKTQPCPSCGVPCQPGELCRQPHPAGHQPGHGPLCGCAPCARNRVVAEILAVLREPIGLPEEDLPSYVTAPAGTCGRCHLGPLYKLGRCVYCYRLENPLHEPPGPVLSPLNRAVAQVLTLAQALAESCQPRTTRNGRCSRCTVPAGHVHTRKCQNASARRGWASMVLTIALFGWLVLLLHGVF